MDSHVGVTGDGAEWSAPHEELRADWRPVLPQHDRFYQPPAWFADALSRARFFARASCNWLFWD